MKKISSMHVLNLRYSRSESLMNKMAMPIFDYAHPKTIERTFRFPEFAPAYKKLVHSICSFLRYSQFQSLVTRLAALILDHTHPKCFWSTLNLCKKSGYFIDLFWIYDSLKNPATWFAENILAHISGTKIFPNIGFVQNHRI